MNNKENKAPEKKGSALRRFFRIPPILKIDFEKPVPFRQQFAIMGTILVMSCFLFTAVYAAQYFAAEKINVSKTSASVPGDQTAGEKDKDNGKTVSNPEKQSSEVSEKEKISKVTCANKDIFKKMSTVVKTQKDVYEGSLILVNKTYPSRLDGENVKLLYEEQNECYVLADYSVGMDAQSITSFNAMLWDFASIYGNTDIMIACGYRSKETQEALRSAEVSGSEEAEAEQWVAPPGYSEHQTGLAFDFDLNLTDGGKTGINYDGEGDYSWLNQNCGDYGFILRYRQGKEDITGYQYEPWHFRYVGYPHSRYIEDHDITLEEYIELIHGHKADNALVLEDQSGSKWCIYYVPADDSGTTDIPVPEDREFEISGDNCVDDESTIGGGYIVTVKLIEDDAPNLGSEVKIESEVSLSGTASDSSDSTGQSESEDTDYETTDYDNGYGYDYDNDNDYDYDYDYGEESGEDYQYDYNTYDYDNTQDYTDYNTDTGDETY